MQRSTSYYAIGRDADAAFTRQFVSSHTKHDRSRSSPSTAFDDNVDVQIPGYRFPCKEAGLGSTTVKPATVVVVGRATWQECDDRPRASGRARRDRCPSGGREEGGELVRELIDLIGRERAGAAGELRDRLGTVDHDAADAELAQRQSVGIREAKRSAYVQITEAGARERGGDELHLALDAVDQLGLIAAGDLQDRMTVGEQTADPLDTDLPAMGLAVDQGDAAGPDRDMIEVGLAGTGNPSVMQQLDRMSGEVLLKALGGASLTLGSLRPALGALGLLDHVSQHRADQAEFLTRVITPALAAPIVLALRADASLAVRTLGGAGDADDRAHVRNDRGQVADNKPLAAGFTAGIVGQPDRGIPRARFHPDPYRPGTPRAATGAPSSQQTSS